MVADCLIPGLCFLPLLLEGLGFVSRNLTLTKIAVRASYLGTHHYDRMCGTFTAPSFSFSSSSFLFWKYSNFRKFERQKNEPLYTPHWDLPIAMCLSSHRPPPRLVRTPLALAEPFQNDQVNRRLYQRAFPRRKDRALHSHKTSTTPNNISINFMFPTCLKMMFAVVLGLLFQFRIHLNVMLHLLRSMGFFFVLFFKSRQIFHLFVFYNTFFFF